MKKRFIFIIVLGLFFIGLPQFKSKALVKDNVDYITLETGIPIEIDSKSLSPITITSVNDSMTFENWYDYLENSWPVHTVEIYLPDVSTIYFYNGSTEVLNSVSNVFKVVIDFETVFSVQLYGLDNSLLYNQALYDNGDDYWLYSKDTIIYTDLVLGGGGYTQDDLDNAYNEGWNEAIADYVANTLPGLLAQARQEGYDEGWDEAVADYIANKLPALLAQATQEGYNDGLAVGYENGKVDAIADYVDNILPGLLDEASEIGYNYGYDEGLKDGFADSNSTFIGSLSYKQDTSTDYTVRFSLPKQTITSSISDILEGVKSTFSGYTHAVYVVRQPENITYEYELRNSNNDIIEIMPKFDMVLFMGDTDEMAILLNGKAVKYYNSSKGIEYMTIRYTGFPGEDYESGYSAGLRDGLLDGNENGYIDGYNEARRELWDARYEVGYNEARGTYGYFNDDTNEWVTASKRYMDGYYAGLRVNNNEAYNTGYDKGYSEGSTDSFSAKLSDWIVPAIVIVLFLGGAIVILNRRMGGSND